VDLGITVDEAYQAKPSSECQSVTFYIRNREGTAKFFLRLLLRGWEKRALRHSMVGLMKEGGKGVFKKCDF
jgi:hypothetical protein